MGRPTTSPNESGTKIVGEQDRAGTLRDSPIGRTVVSDTTNLGSNPSLGTTGGRMALKPEHIKMYKGYCA